LFKDGQAQTFMNKFNIQRATDKKRIGVNILEGFKPRV
jgi:hypothetical protein